jgi:addiction module HigA family antidote
MRSVLLFLVSSKEGECQEQLVAGTRATSGSYAGITANALALALRIPANRLTEIINGRRSISADTALPLARYFGTSARMWMNRKRDSTWRQLKTC